MIIVDIWFLFSLRHLKRQRRRRSSPGRAGRSITTPTWTRKKRRNNRGKAAHSIHSGWSHARGTVQPIKISMAVKLYWLLSDILLKPVKGGIKKCFFSRFLPCITPLPQHFLTKLDCLAYIGWNTLFWGSTQILSTLHNSCPSSSVQESCCPASDEIHVGPDRSERGAGSEEEAERETHGDTGRVIPSRFQRNKGFQIFDKKYNFIR